MKKTLSNIFWWFHGMLSMILIAFAWTGIQTYRSFHTETIDDITVGKLVGKKIRLMKEEGIELDEDDKVDALPIGFH